MSKLEQLLWVLTKDMKEGEAITLSMVLTKKKGKTEPSNVDRLPSAEVMRPSPPLLVKLGSIIVHAEELASPEGHQFDLATLQHLLADPDVKAWMKEMDRLTLLPRKRSEHG
jgi:hypothetical protein